MHNRNITLKSKGLLILKVTNPISQKTFSVKNGLFVVGLINVYVNDSKESYST